MSPRRLVGASLLALAPCCSLSVHEKDYVGGAKTSADAGDLDGSAADASDAGPSCNLDAGFGEPMLVPGFEDIVTYAPRLTADELTIYFHHDDMLRLYVATRSSRDARFGAPNLLSGDVNASGANGNPWISPDGLVIVFTSDRAGGSDLYWGRRDSRFGTFTEVTKLVSLSSMSANETEPFLRADLKEIFFTTDSTGTISTQVRADLSGEPPSGTPAAISALQGNGANRDPVLTADGLTLYFSSTRDGDAERIWRTKRTALDQPFGAPERVEELKVTEAHPGWISPDGCRLYLATVPLTNPSDARVRMAERPR